jgi:diphthamide synthase (EF-2-diphthine--ammonia ligase)
VATIPHPCPNAAYEEVMGRAVSAARAAGVEAIAFGDLALQEIRSYREQMMIGTGLKALFPLWGRPTAALAREMIERGLRAVVTCVDPRVLPAALAGHPFDEAFLAALPAGVDPCGEVGEYHTFAWDGPMFGRPVPVRVGETVTRDGFVFADVLPEGV